MGIGEAVVLDTAAMARPQSSSLGIGEAVVLDVGIQLPWLEHKALLRAPAKPSF
jgi:hypothetical protein